MLTILEKADLLQNVDIFGTVPTQSLARVAAIAQEVSYEARQVLFSESDAADAMFVLLDGEVVLTQGGSAARKLNQFQTAGTFSLLSNRFQTETAKASHVVHTLRIRQQELFNVMAEDFDVTRGILQALASMALR